MSGVRIVVTVAILMTVGALAPEPALAHHNHPKQKPAAPGAIQVGRPRPGHGAFGTSERECFHQKALVPLVSPVIGWVNKFGLGLGACYRDGELVYFNTWPIDVNRSWTHWNLVRVRVEALTVRDRRAYVRLRGKYEICFPLVGVWCDTQTIWVSASTSSARYAESLGTYYADFGWGGTDD